MYNLEAIFDDLAEKAVMYSTCRKVAVGCLIVTGSGHKFYGSNNGEYNCKVHDDCYKAKVTGIYESCEETRKYCQSTHAEINALNALMDDISSNKNPEKRAKKLDADNSTIFVTRYPCLNCAKKIVEYGYIKEVYYAGDQLISDEVSEIFKSAGISVTHFDKDYEDLMRDKWWTDKFYDEAYDIVKDRKAPFTIISYNNPDLPTLSRFQVDKMDEEYNYPIFIFVRTSQKEMYEKATEKYKYVQIIDFPDELISNAGAVRRQSQKWLYDQGYSIAFQFDDDVEFLTYVSRGYKKSDGTPKSETQEGVNISKILAMWQVAMEEAIDRDNVILSCGMPTAFSWKPEYCQSYDSYLLSRGALTQLICWNVKAMVEQELFYRDNPEVGLDDIDMTVRVLKSGNNVCCFPWLAYGCDPMGNPGQSLEDLQKRFQFSQDKLKEHHGDMPWLKFRMKRNLPQACIYFPTVRKWQVQKGIWKNEDYIFDIWNNGELLDKARMRGNK